MNPHISWKSEDGNYGPAHFVVGAPYSFDADYSPLFNGEWVNKKKAKAFAKEKQLDFIEY